MVDQVHSFTFGCNPCSQESSNNTHLVMISIGNSSDKKIQMGFNLVKKLAYFHYNETHASMNCQVYLKQQNS
jgi:hypothetical protein